VRATEPDRLYADAHSLPIEYLATTGLVGAALFLAWLVTVAKSVQPGKHPELAAAALTLFAFHLANPHHLTLTPLMFLLAGTAAARPGQQGRRRLAAIGPVMLASVALVVSGRLIAGDLLFRAADTDFDLSRMETASAMLWPWPDPVSAEARIHAFQARTQKRPAELRAAVMAARRARDRDPDNPIRHVALGSLLAQAGDHTEAARVYSEALELNPWSHLALEGRAAALSRLGDPTAAAACRRAADVDRGPDRLLEGSRATCLR
jgi:tetratricopeptide (TPR) repeat protein